MLNKALALDPNCAEAYVNRGTVRLLRDWNLKAAEQDLVHAVELEPNNDTAHWTLALVLSDLGRFDEALKEMDVAQAIDPSAVAYMFHRGRILYYARRYDAAIEQLKQAIEVDDRFMQTYGSMVRVYETTGDYDTAFQYFLKREERGRRSEQLENYKKIYATEGWLSVRRGVADSGANDFDMARLYSLTDNKDPAFESLQKAVDSRNWLIATLNVEPAFDNIRDDPRFIELVRSLQFERG
jgi:tetratricopeptide (TPR) repeat protein